MIRLVLIATMSLMILPVVRAQDEPGAGAPERLQMTGDRPTILVLPFAQISEDGRQDWIAKAMHQSMQAEIARLHFIEPTAPQEMIPTSLPTDTTAALQAGRDAGTDFVLFGSFQTIGEELRATGQIMDVAAGETIGGIKATGALQDLFGIEDILANQIKRELAMQIVAGAPMPTTLPAGNAIDYRGPIQVEPARNGYAGSELERAVLAGTTETSEIEQGRNRYQYQTPTAPWEIGYRTYTPYVYPYFPYRWYGGGHRHGRGGGRIIGGGPINNPDPTPPLPNNNYIIGPSNVMQGGPSNVMQGGPSNVMQSSPGNTMGGSPGNTMGGGGGNTQK